MILKNREQTLHECNLVSSHSLPFLYYFPITCYCHCCIVARTPFLLFIRFEFFLSLRPNAFHELSYGGGLISNIFWFLFHSFIFHLNGMVTKRMNWIVWARCLKNCVQRKNAFFVVLNFSYTYLLFFVFGFFHSTLFMEMQLTDWIIMKNNDMRYDNEIRYGRALLFCGIIFELLNFIVLSWKQNVFSFFIGSPKPWGHPHLVYSLWKAIFRIKISFKMVWQWNDLGTLRIYFSKSDSRFVETTSFIYCFMDIFGRRHSFKMPYSFAIVQDTDLYNCIRVHINAHNALALLKYSLWQ